MSEYWKSTPKKFCDCCKCWIADNRASIQFHENGKNHKENMTKKISELRRKGLKEQREKAEFDEDMKKIEEAALQAYQEDVFKNPDVTGSEVQKKLEEMTGQKIDKEHEWYEAKSEEGHTYYWNVKTNATQWQPPATGFLSLEEQTKSPPNPVHKETPKPTGIKVAKPALVFKKKVQKKEEPLIPTHQFGPAPAQNAYGSWESVPDPESSAPESVDLQLPAVDAAEINVPSLHPDTRFTFKTKTVESLGGLAEFKKRKVKEDVRRNVRTRGDD